MPHPVGERDAGWFHMYCAVVGILHFIVGLGSIYYHAVAARNHFIDARRLGD
jgi:hypothetical protein